MVLLKDIVEADAKRYFEEFSQHVGKTVRVKTHSGRMLEGKLADIFISHTEETFVLHWFKLEMEPNLTHYVFGLPDALEVLHN